ncbi:MAG: zinc chelation protein SecC [Chloroflexi bacterium]|nr:zinc chelation protein SecC [Chloroflexota bacterium]
MNKMSQCPCHSGQPYKICCQPFHNGKKPPTPVALMRSRYAAYALDKVGYVVKTEYPNSPRLKKDVVGFRKEVKVFCQTTDFIGLQILAESKPGEVPATVTFHAVLMQQGHDVSFTECSLFELVKGRWFYVRPLEGQPWGK